MELNPQTMNRMELIEEMRKHTFKEELDSLLPKPTAYLRAWLSYQLSSAEDKKDRPKLVRWPKPVPDKIFTIDLSTADRCGERLPIPAWLGDMKPLGHFEDVRIEDGALMFRPVFNNEGNKFLEQWRAKLAEKERNRFFKRHGRIRVIDMGVARRMALVNKARSKDGTKPLV